MGSQTIIRGDVRVERTVVPADASGSAEFPNQWHVRLTVSAEHDFPVAVRVCDRLPPALGAPNVALPPDEGAERWTIDTNTVACRTVVRPGDSTVATYLLHTDAVDEASLVGATAIESVQPLDPAVRDVETSARREPASDHVSAETHGTVRTPDGVAATRGLGNGHAAASDGEGIESVLRFEASERAAAENDFLVPRGTDTDPLVSIVMPTMNEEAGIRECIERATAALEALGLPGEIIVSDSSEDRTPEIAAELGAHVVTPDGTGYGYAYQYAFERVRGEFVVIGDADTTYDFEELPKLFECLQRTEADMVMGSRLDGEITPGAMPALHQYVGNPLLTKFLNAFYDAGVSDAHSGFRVIRHDALERLDLQSDGMEFASEMIMQAAERGLRIEEVPIVYHHRAGEATLDSFRDGWRHVRFMLLNAPGYLFTGPAIGLGIVGVVMMLLSLMNRSFAGVHFGQYTMIAGSLVVILGYQVGSLGLFSAVAAEPIRSPRDPVTKLITDRFQLEHGTTLGLGLFGAGALYTTVLVVRWVQSGYTELPIVPVNMLAFTILVLGAQTVFYSFFLSLLAGAK
jgi:glycosyltransferase involved in cell wall biosynthesis